MMELSQEDLMVQASTALQLGNRLNESLSPYVRAHANNPVAWQTWEPETLALAKRHNRLLFVSIGWCHVMERDSFQSSEIARILNNSFVPVKVDREERPDLDAIYLPFIHLLHGSAGWPMNLFLTPELEPLYGGTYLPGPNDLLSPFGGDDKVNQKGLLEVLEYMRDIWMRDEAKCRFAALQNTENLRNEVQEGVPDDSDFLEQNNQLAGLDSPELDRIEEARQAMIRNYDTVHHGFSVQPKFYGPIKLRFLLQLGQWPNPIPEIVGEEECKDSRERAVETLRTIARGGVRDHAGLGFFRCSVTRDWSLPDFGKILPDQALLLDAFCDAYTITRDEEILGAMVDAARYITSSPILRNGGGFFSSEDADSSSSVADANPQQGAFYVWEKREVVQIIGAQDYEIFAAFYNVRTYGNVSTEYHVHDELRRRNVLWTSTDPQSLADNLGMSAERVGAVLSDALRKLREYREAHRPRPLLDAKILTSWNALAVAALARASHLIGWRIGESQHWLDTAKKTARFLLALWDPHTGTLPRIWYDGVPGPACGGLADDYAATALAALELYHVTLDGSWLRWADKLAETLIERFAAPEGGFYTAAADGPHAGGSNLLLRLKPAMDNTEPSTNTLAVQVLFRLASLLGDERYKKQALRTLAIFENEMEHASAAYPGLLWGVAWAHFGGKCVWLIGEDATGSANAKVSEDATMSETNVMEHLRQGLGLGRTVLRVRKEDSWLRKRNPLVGAFNWESNDGKSRVVVCENGECRTANDLDEL